MHIHIIHRTRPLRHASTLLSTRTTHVKIVKIVRSRSSGVSHGASGYTKRNQFGSKLRIFEYLRMLRKCHREAMFSWASPIFTCLLHGGVSQMTCCIFVFSEQQRPIQHAGVNKKWKKWQGQEEKTCPADGPALRARKAQSTGEAKKARPKQNKEGKKREAGQKPSHTQAEMPKASSLRDKTRAEWAEWESKKTFCLNAEWAEWAECRVSCILSGQIHWSQTMPDLTSEVTASNDGRLCVWSLAMLNTPQECQLSQTISDMP